MNTHIISHNASLLDALDRLNRLSGSEMTLLAIDDADRMVGTLTDGDIRRALLRQATLSTPVSEVMHRDFKYIQADNTDVALLRRYRRLGITLIPCLDADRHIVDIYDLSTTHTILPLRAILMAGGKGERLRPLTLTTPKPLLPICGKPIIDYNIEALAACGITDINVTTNYLAEQLHAHFASPVAGVSVRCVKEPAPLGTIGSAALVPESDLSTTLIMNSDLLTNISFEDMYLHHLSQQADITIASIPYTVSIPFAIFNTEGQEVRALEEKPTYTYQANAGIYLIRTELLSSITPGERVDAPDFVEKAIADGRKVTFFPINGTWIDIGSPSDFRQAEQLMAHLADWKK